MKPPDIEQCDRCIGDISRQRANNHHACIKADFASALLTTDDCAAVVLTLSLGKSCPHVFSFPGERAETIERGSAGHVGETSPLQLGH